MKALAYPLVLFEELLEQADKDFESICTIYSRLVLSEYRQFDAFWFPCQAKYTKYALNPKGDSYAYALEQKHKYEEIDACEMGLQKAQNFKENSRVQMTHKIQIAPETVHINAPLSEADFRVVIPGHLPVTDWDRKKDGKPGLSWQQWRATYISLATGIILLTLLAFLRKLSRTKKRP